jgi:hypothetical protein
VRDEGLYVGMFEAQAELVTLKRLADWASICVNKPTITVCLDYADDDVGEMACAVAAIELLEGMQLKFIIFSRHSTVLREIGENYAHVKTGLLVKKLSEEKAPFKEWFNFPPTDFMGIDYEDGKWGSYMGLAIYIENSNFEVRLCVNIGKFGALAGKFTELGIVIVTECYGSSLLEIAANR